MASVRTTIDPWNSPAPAADPNDLLARAAALAGFGAWECDLATSRLTWTAGVYDLFGFDPGRPVDRAETVALYHEECRVVMERVRADAIARGTSFRIDVRIQRTDGEQRWMRLAGDVIRDHGRAVRMYGMKQDITAERAQWDALRRLAEHDPLTGLHSRAVYQSRFLDAPRADPVLRPLGALVLIDVDGFKQVNDRHGHMAGDACLKAAGERLAACFTDALLIARVGGDEFAVLTGTNLSVMAVERRIGRFLHRLSEPVPWQDGLLHIGASAGMAMVDDPCCYDAQALYAAADTALYAAKAGGRNTFRKAA